jgi:hypothetical protein
MYDAGTREYTRLPLLDTGDNILDNRIMLDVAIRAED